MDLKSLPNVVILLTLSALLLGVGLIVLGTLEDTTATTSTNSTSGAYNNILNGSARALTMYDENYAVDTTGESSLVSLTSVTSTSNQTFAVTGEAITLLNNTAVSVTYDPFNETGVAIYNATMTLGSGNYTLDGAAGTVTLTNNTYNNTAWSINYTHYTDDITTSFTVQTGANTITLTEALYNNTNWNVAYIYSYTDHSVHGRAIIASENALGDLPDWFSTIVLVIAASIILMLVMTQFGRRREDLF